MEMEMECEIESPYIRRRLEVFNLCFDYNVRDSYTEFYSPSSSRDSNIAFGFSNNKVTELPGHFRGRIFVGDTHACEDFVFTEIYNSDTVGSVYVDLQKEMQDDPESQKSSKRKMGGFISGRHTEVKDSEDSQKRAKQDNEEMQKSSGASTFNLPHTVPNDEEEEEMQVAYEFSKSSGNLFNLPLTGPNKGMLLVDSFLVVIHKDTDNRNKEEEYEREAYKEYSYAGYVHPDDVGVWTAVRLSNFNTPFEYHLYNDFRKLKMNCMVMENTKVVDVRIKWCMPTSHICGEISVSCDKFLGNKCYLIQTPQKKFVMAEEGKFINMCRFTVTVPYSSDFTVSAMLHDPNNALLVDESVSFPSDPKNHSYKSTLTMKGKTGGCIEVVATVCP